MNNTYNVLYFGCWDHHKGHFLYAASGKKIHAHPLLPFIDGGFLNRENDMPARHGWVEISRIGTRFTVLSFWDGSMDSRPGSHSDFIVDGMVSYEKAMELAGRDFPQIFDRFKFHVTRAHVDCYQEPEANSAAG